MERDKKNSTRDWHTTVRDISLVGSAIVAILVVSRSIGSIYVERSTLKEHERAIAELTGIVRRIADDYQQHRYESATYISEFKEVQKRLDECCPRYHRGVGK